MKLKMGGYLYSLRSGRFIVTEIMLYEDVDNYCPKFILMAIGNNTLLRMPVSAKQGDIHNGVLWFEDRDDSKAISLLVSDEEAKIIKLKESIDNHEYKISVLKQGVSALK